MKIFLIWRRFSQSNLRCSNGVSGVLVRAYDEPSARAKAQAAAKTGETRVHAEWSCDLLGEVGSLPGGREVLFLGELFDDARRQP